MTVPAVDVKNKLARALTGAGAVLAVRGERSPAGALERQLMDVMGPLYTDPEGHCAAPRACSAAELCFALAAFALVSKKPINVLLAENGRVPGDRSVTDYLAKTLLPQHGVPASKGAMQSSTLRSGYSAAHARNKTVAAFVAWLDKQDVANGTVVDEMFSLMAEQFMLHRGETTRAIAVASTAEMTFPRFQAALVKLFKERSNGALQQYVLSALLMADADANERPIEVSTKGLFTADAVLATAGDVTVSSRDGTVMLAYEVSASPWTEKLGQALETLADGLAPRVVIAAKVPANVTADTVLRAIESHPGFQGCAEDVDVAVIDLTQLCLSYAAALPPAVLADALRRTAEMVREHAATRTDLVTLIEALMPSDAADQP